MIDNLTEAIIHAREKAKELNDMADNWKRLSDEKGLSLPSDYAPCKECAAEHEQLADWLEELAKRREADRWIPVSERLPKSGNKAYLVTVDYGLGVTTSCQRFFFNDEIGWNDDSVIAWKPLPEPYKENDNG